MINRKGSRDQGSRRHNPGKAGRERKLERESEPLGYKTPSSVFDEKKEQDQQQESWEE